MSKWSAAAIEAKFKARPEVSEVQEAFKAVNERVDKLEEWAGVVGSVIFTRGFWGKLRWLLTGK